MDTQLDLITEIRKNYDLLSNNHRKIADYVTQNLQEAAFISINELSQRIGVSPATITRFVRKLGYPGYSSFQSSIHKNMNQYVVPFGSLKSLLRSEARGEDLDYLRSGVSRNLELIENIYTPTLQAAFDRSLEILRQARRIYISGQRSSYTAAYHLAFMLQQVRNNVHLLSPVANSLPSELVDVQSDDCLVLVSYAKYTTTSFNVVSYFAQQSCKVISITDSLTSPIALKSTEVLIAPNGANYSPVSAITVCDCIISAVGRFDAKSSLERMEKQDEIALAQKVYI